ncbi:PucR family transcriptional regulator [Kutzneria buriramensis]|uniref:DNA-binding PucR family transcriptional regulator n=1 Tax=Kutzneria buriramensis TaxID=1045776 RepID=A0A3E0HHE3_9PSEU|nr:PucR family transcriptional regulator [Kutzneria buriramensis]REH44766.1 DNA-binding PucR family transcriptional regulator [Kutzneria buriramensis]
MALGRTSTVPLGALVGRPALGLVVLTGSDQLDRPIRWAHVSELRDPVPYLLGGELLLTAGVNFPEDVDAYVRGLVTAGVQALGFGITPVYDEVPARLVEACTRHGLPLLALPPSTPFLAVSQAVSVALAEAEHAELRWLSEAQATLTRAALRPNPVRAVVGELAGLADWWCVLVGADGVLAQVGVDGVDPAVFELAARVRTGSGPRSASTEIGSSHVVAYPVEPGEVLVVGAAAPFSVADRAVIAVALALLALAERADGRSVTKMLVGEDDFTGYRVVRGRRKSRAGKDFDLGTALVDVEGGRLRAVVTTSPDVVAAQEAGWLLAVSSPVGVGDLPSADREAERMLERAVAIGRPVTGADGVAALVDPAAAARFATSLLEPLAQRPELVTTLRTWLACNGNWDRTAAELGVHRNSVRHRIGVVARELAIDLSDAQRRMELWFALRWSD